MLKICVSGWYFHQPLYEALSEASFKAFVVKNREGDTSGIPSTLNHQMSPTGGKGLDFGCYQQYLMEEWDGAADVLFMQDDGEVQRQRYKEDEDDYDTRSFGQISELCGKQIDHAYIFRDEYEEAANAGISSRAMWFRGSFLKTIKDDGGFDVDWANEGNTEGRQANLALNLLDKKLRPLERCTWIAIIPGLMMGRRGYLANEPYQYKRVNKDGIVTPAGNA